MSLIDYSIDLRALLMSLGVFICGLIGFTIRYGQYVIFASMLGLWLLYVKSIIKKEL